MSRSNKSLTVFNELVRVFISCGANKWPISAPHGSLKRYQQLILLKLKNQDDLQNYKDSTLITYWEELFPVLLSIISYMKAKPELWDSLEDISKDNVSTEQLVTHYAIDVLFYGTVPDKSLKIKADVFEYRNNLPDNLKQELLEYAQLQLETLINLKKMAVAYKAYLDHVAVKIFYYILT